MRQWKKHSDYFSQNDKLITHATTQDIFTEPLRNRLTLRITAFENYVAAVAAWGTFQI